MDLERLLYRLRHEPETLTVDERYCHVSDVRTRGDAAEYLLALIEDGMRRRPCLSFDEAATIERVKIGYLGGYLPFDERLRVEDLFGCVHPFAGKARPERDRRVQLDATFVAMCGVWDTQRVGDRSMGMHRQPRWDLTF